MCDDLIRHYDALIDEENDPVNDPPALRAYMDRWDGAPFLALLALDGTQSVLELGVGSGRLAVRTAPASASFTGIDLSPKTIARAHSHLAPYPHVRLVCGDFLTYPFEERFDVVYSSLTFLHVQDKSAAAARVAALLRCGGRAVLSLDKGRDEYLCADGRVLRVWPDDPSEMRVCLTAAGLCVTGEAETEAAWLLAAEKRCR